MSETFCFSVSAAATPQVLPRVFDVLARHGLTPVRCHAQSDGGPGLFIDLQLHGLDKDAASRLALGLDRLIEVDRVLMSAKCG